MNIKIILLGDTNVGKTRLSNKYTYNTDLLVNTPTIGVEYFIKLYNKDNFIYNVQIWDTAGQERFRSIVRVFYKNNHACILVFDITNKKSLDNLQFWLNNFLEHSDNNNIYLIGNKIDLKHDKISYNIIQLFLQNNKNIIKFYEVSALTGENVVDSFNDIIQHTIQNIYSNEININNTLNIELENEKNINKKCC